MFLSYSVRLFTLLVECSLTLTIECSWLMANFSQDQMLVNVTFIWREATNKRFHYTHITNILQTYYKHYGYYSLLLQDWWNIRKANFFVDPLSLQTKVIPLKASRNCQPQNSIPTFYDPKIKLFKYSYNFCFWLVQYFHVQCTFLSQFQLEM